MTDGIIQEAFKPRIAYHKHVLSNAEKDGIAYKISEALLQHDEQLQQELIAKIEKTFPPIKHSPHMLVIDGITTYDAVRYKLIGNGEKKE